MGLKDEAGRERVIMFRWTIKDLETLSDLEIIRDVLKRQETLTNMYSPLSNRKLKELYGKVDNKIKKGKKNI